MASSMSASRMATSGSPPIPVIGGDPDVAMRLADMLDAMPLDVQRYKGVADVSAALIDFLRRGASGASLDMV